jgi:hypothetical protein
MLGEKLIIKLWDSIADKGIGGLLAPWQILREGDARTEARRREILLLADAEKKAEEIRKGDAKLIVEKSRTDLLPSGRVKSIETVERIESEVDFQHVIEIADSRKRLENVRAEINVAKAIIFAEEELVNEQQSPPDRSIDDDWLFKWHESASKVSAEELQQLWGKVLAGEVKSPGQFSFRTMEFLKNISQEEAQLITKLAQFNISGCIARNEQDILVKNGISFDDLMYLQELGIVNGVEAIGMSTEFKSTIENSFQRALTSNGKALLLLNEDTNKKLSLSSYGLTNLGKQILTLGKFEFNQEYLNSIGKKFAAQGFNVQLGDWTQMDESRGKLSNLVIIKQGNA